MTLLAWLRRMTRGAPDMPPPAPPAAGRFCPEDPSTPCRLEACYTLGCADQRYIYRTPPGMPLGTAPIDRPHYCIEPLCLASTGDCFGPCHERDQERARRAALMKRRARFRLAPSTPRIGRLR